MKVTIKLFSFLRTQIPCDSSGRIELEVEKNITVGQLLSGLDFWQEKGMIALLNGCGSKDVKLIENDELQIFPLVVGG